MEKLTYDPLCNVTLLTYVRTLQPKRWEKFPTTMNLIEINSHCSCDPKHIHIITACFIIWLRR